MPKSRLSLRQSPESLWFRAGLDASALGVEVWWVDLDEFRDQSAELAKLLSPDELTRAERFIFPIHRERFVRCRGWLRELLSGYVDLPPKTLRFEYGANGKPTLAGLADGEHLHFNLSHSENIAAVAVSRVGPVGVDIERVRETMDWAELVEEHFSERERVALRSLPESERLAAFYRGWTRKEALLKATGEGLGEDLGRVQVAIHPNQPAKVLAMGRDSAAAKRWRLFDLALPAGSLGAVAVRTLFACQVRSLPCCLNRAVPGRTVVAP